MKESQGSHRPSSDLYNQDTTTTHMYCPHHTPHTKGEKKAIVKVNMPYCHGKLGRDRAEDKANLFLASKPRDTAGMVRCCPGLFKGCKASFPETAHQMGSVLWPEPVCQRSWVPSFPPSLLTCHQPQLLWLPFSHQSSLFSHHCKPVGNGWDKFRLSIASSEENKMEAPLYPQTWKAATRMCTVKVC